MHETQRTGDSHLRSPVSAFYNKLTVHHIHSTLLLAQIRPDVGVSDTAYHRKWRRL